MHRYKYIKVKKWASCYFDRFFCLGLNIVQCYMRNRRIKEIKINVQKEAIYNMLPEDIFKVAIKFRDLMSRKELDSYLKGVFGMDSRAFTIQEHVFEDFESFNVYTNDNIHFDNSSEESKDSSSEDEYDLESLFECIH